MLESITAQREKSAFCQGHVCHFCIEIWKRKVDGVHIKYIYKSKKKKTHKIEEAFAIAFFKKRHNVGIAVINRDYYITRGRYVEIACSSVSTHIKQLLSIGSWLLL